MREAIGYSAYNIFEDVYEYNENECFIADSIESLRDFLKGAGFSVEDFRAKKVHISDILDDYGASGGNYCMEPEALKKFEQEARITGTTYSQEEYDEDLVNVEVDLPAKVYQAGKTSPNSQAAELSSKIIQTEIPSLKSDQKRLDEYLFDVRDVLGGLMVSYTSVVSDKGSITRGGKEASFRMLHMGHEYLIEDLYCSNPDCNCKEVHLQFFKVLPELSGKPGIIDCFMAEMSFGKGRMQINELFKSNKKDAEELMMAWKAQHPDIVHLLQDRYRKIKEIGERSLKDKGLYKIPDSVSKTLISKTVIRERKIGRNEPCPCGSGKKYKKCCGA